MPTIHGAPAYWKAMHRLKLTPKMIQNLVPCRLREDILQAYAEPGDGTWPINCREHPEAGSPIKYDRLNMEGTTMAHPTWLFKQQSNEPKQCPNCQAEQK